MAVSARACESMTVYLSPGKPRQTGGVSRFMGFGVGGLRIGDRRWPEIWRAREPREGVEIWRVTTGDSGEGGNNWRRQIVGDAAQAGRVWAGGREVERIRGIEGTAE